MNKYEQLIFCLKILIKTPLNQVTYNETKIPCSSFSQKSAKISLETVSYLNSIICYFTLLIINSPRLLLTNGNGYIYIP